MNALILLLALAADVEPDDPAAMKVREITPPARLGVPRGGEPLKIASEEELKKAASGDTLAALKKQVDLRKEYLLVFTWAGSGGDRLSVEVEKGKGGPVAMFRKTPGLTNDLRRHQKVFALPRKMTYRVSK
jgi:hypothetical protein